MSMMRALFSGSFSSSGWLYSSFANLIRLSWNKLATIREKDGDDGHRGPDQSQLNPVDNDCPKYEKEVNENPEGEGSQALRHLKRKKDFLELCTLSAVH